MAAINTVFTDPQVGPIADAVHHGDVQQIHRLANEKLLHQQGKQAITLLQWAIFNQKPESLQALLQAHASPAQPGLQGDTAWHTAASVKDARYLHILLDGPLSPNVRNEITLATPLATAVMSGSKAQVSLLLTAGVNPDLFDRVGDSPLHLAGKINAADLVLILLEAGADPELRNKQGFTFQQYLAMTPEHLQCNKIQKKIQQLNNWLRVHQFKKYNKKADSEVEIKVVY